MTRFPKARGKTNPAPGLRDATAGILFSVGNNGYNWSSTIHTTYGTFLDFRTTFLQPNYASNRAHGLQLRCLSE
ncbi:hypothetical protein [uncultured Rikenella sp.]|uniref:hypothetical protein n=1 Tax=uncultured Rikenella sp. TaxID=368003 RepID=UPI0025FAB548|nr:hypothetical protein [uncultured Rikenella sp.]